MIAITRPTFHGLALALVLVSPILMGVDSCERVKVLAGQSNTAGVYKGSVDPLTLESAAQRATTLSERLQLIQAR